MGTFQQTLAQIQQQAMAQQLGGVAQLPDMMGSTTARLAGASIDPANVGEGYGPGAGPQDPLSIAAQMQGALAGTSGGVSGMLGATTGRPFNGQPMGNLDTHAGVTGVAPAIDQLIAARRKTGDPIFRNVVSDYRTRAEQAALYQRYLSGNGNLAAPPGQSNHETGTAFDISSSFLAQNPDVVRYLLNHGFDRDVGGEPWHFHWTGR